MINLKEFGRKLPWPEFKVLFGIAQEELRKATKNQSG
jgi:hypothetical protein